MSEFVFANFFKIFKKYLNKSISNYEFAYFLFCKVNKDKDDQKTELKINDSQVSRIINRVDDVPVRVRNYYCDTKNRNETIELFEDYLDDKFEEGKEDDLSDELKDLYMTDSTFSDSDKEYLNSFVDDDFSVFFAEVYKSVLKRDNRLSSFSFSLYSKGNTSVNLLVDDILKIGFNNKYVSGKRIVVIPVDTSFDMTLTNPDEVVQHVSPRSIHGKWIIKMNDKKIDKKSLNDLIQTSLKSRYCSSDETYPIGAIAVVKFKETYFYLIAISIFDKNGVAHSDIDSFKKALDCLIEYYNINGQGHPIYLPLIGTGRSRLSISHTESYEYIKNAIMNKIENLSGIINIVVFKDDIEKMEGLFDGIQK